ncbi:MAG TPA: hypothetical protein VFQ53_16135 [Kofleriaceae bacterium]|nr:hypothetical protein [Kofleriaceae bacterium]
MTTLGRNVKITAPASAREQARSLFALLGAERQEPNPQMDVFLLDGNARVGYAYVDDAAALSADQMRVAPWLELTVDDVERRSDELGKLGLARLEYIDKSHPYFIGPGGVVFRLAST